MIELKVIGACWATGAVALVAATAADASTNTLVMVGVITGVGTALVGVYSAFRAAKHRADVFDQVLVQRQLDEAMSRLVDEKSRNAALKDEIVALRDEIKSLRSQVGDEIKSLRSQVQIWKDLHDQISRAAGGGKASPGTGAAPP